MPGVNGVLAKIGAAVVLKLLCGGDDVVWLAPFLARESKWGKCVVAQKYLAVVAVLCSLAVGLATTVHFATHASAGGKEERVVDKAVACFAGALLLAYAAHLAVEEGRCAGARAVAPEKEEEVESLLRREKRDAAYGSATFEESDEEYEEDLNCCEDAVRLCLESGLRVDEDPEADAARKRFIIVAALGNLDDLIVYFTIALTCTLRWYELVLGTVIGAAFLVTAVSTCLQNSHRATACVSEIPVSFILTALATYIIISAFVPAISPKTLDSKA